MDRLGWSEESVLRVTERGRDDCLLAVEGLGSVWTLGVGGTDDSVDRAALRGEERVARLVCCSSCSVLPMMRVIGTEGSDRVAVTALGSVDVLLTEAADRERVTRTLGSAWSESASCRGGDG